ncbi:condensin subunit YCG1 Ecym_8165 [Eremothecium cymbalariae DBVPG|uniref:Nuclear condensin complex subunit 3 C-terminal domain-containing protein n=1 Tax=Eremothecium cymbalariae (strain CBS 270.75 / DBVPG 7215 / KCTC 17166 / NRRL Y-17582) TaxID=931890 RepID=G8JX78_ERECY|nr:Hypothetical protein Ecym_8165 [Eremothecium cymbalariae DBVPG\
MAAEASMEQSILTNKDTLPNGINTTEETSVNQKIFRAIAEVFQSAQSTYAGHRRHIAVLNKVYSKCIEQQLHESFNYWFNKLVVRILSLKKQEIIGDRIVRLVAAFIASNELALQKKRAENGGDEKTEQIFGAFLNQFIRFLLHGIESRDKNVRYRVTQLLAVIMDNMGEIDEELYDLIIWSMQKRVHDKEPNVRVQAIFCLTKFQDDEHESLDSSADPATESLVHALQNDPSAEIRRAAMLNLANNKNTQHLIFERARDVAAINRRLIYSKVLKSMGPKVFTQLDSSLLDQLVQLGLEDRDETVRQACGKLVAFDWLNLMDGDIIDLLDKLDVTKGKVAEKAMCALFEYRSDIVNKIKFPKDVWDNFSIITVFLLKSFYYHCLEHEMNELIEENFPETMVLSKYITTYISKRYESKDEQSQIDEKALDFIIEQLLYIAYKYDFSDEIGRRDMLNLVRNLLFNKDLSESLVKISLKVLKVLSINERDFITMSVEIITDIRDEDIEKQENEEVGHNSISKNRKDDVIDEEKDEVDEDKDYCAVESFHSAVDDLVSGNINACDSNNTVVIEEKQPSPESLLVCLKLTRYMLELVEKPLKQNIMISSLIDTLITPAVRNTQSDIRELGVRCLGLCCLLDVQLATESMYILGMCVSKGNVALKNIALQVIIDIFSVHGSKVVDGEGKVDSISLHKIFYKILKNNELADCQTVAAEGLCKLFLGDVFIDDDLFETLVLSYFSPANSGNEALIQAFAFCLPVYCFSHFNHQQRMARVASDVLLRLSMLWDDLQNPTDGSNMSKDSMLKPNAIFQQLINWTDPCRLVAEDEKSAATNECHIDFLLDILRSYYRFERKDVKKMLITNLSRFKVTGQHSVVKIKEAIEHLEDILENDTTDKTCKNCLNALLENYKSLVPEAEEHSINTTKQEDDNSIGEFSAILAGADNSSLDVAGSSTQSELNTESFIKDSGNGQLQSENTEQGILNTLDNPPSRKRLRSADDS